VSEKTLKTIRIKWVRSGIGFTYHQKTIVRSLGLNKLNHTVVRPDTPQIRGIVAAVPHLLEIVAEPVAPAWASIPEYTVYAPAAAPVKTVVAEPVATEPVAAEIVATETALTENKPAKPRKKKTSAPEGSEPAKAGKE
jgi:large subunit ribosomal protein L30